MKTVQQLFLKELPFFLAIPAFMWQLLFFCIPLLFILLMSIVAVIPGIDHTAISYQHYTAFFSWQYAQVIMRSLVLATCTALTCALFAYPIAYHLIFNVQRWRTYLLFLLMLPFWTNFLVQIYAWFFVLDTYGLINSFLLKLGLITTPLHLLNSTGAMYLVMFYCYLPFMIMPIYSSLEKFDTRLFEASADLGAGAAQTFLRITLPLSAHGLRTGFFLVFVPAFGEFVIPALVGGGKKLYVGTLIAHYFLVARNASAGSAFTVVTGLVLLLSAGIIYYLFKYLFSMRGVRSHG